MRLKAIQIVYTTKDIERFERKVDKAGECWLWTGCRNEKGYGFFRLQGNSILAHRFAFVVYGGKEPGELLICHHCDNPPCVNPAHLFMGSDQENTRDSWNKGRRNVPRGAAHPESRKTHCPKGHEYSPDNLVKSTQGRVCKRCLRNRSREWYWRHKSTHSG